MRFPSCLPLCVVFLVAGTAGALSQQQVAAQSGEHDTFSRIVFPLDAQVEWNVEQTERQATIAFKGLETAPDTSGVLARLPSGRLSGIRSTRGALELDLGCDCSVEAFRFDGRYVVIDVVDGSGTPSVAEEQVGNTTPGEFTLAPYTPNNVASFAENLPFLDTSGANERKNEEKAALSEAALAARVADALEVQLLAPSGAMPPRAEGEAIGVLSQIEINTPFRNQPVQLSEQAAEICALPMDVDITQWPSRMEVFRSLGLLRREVFDDKGEAKSGKTRPLAVAYLSLGFGAEARSILDLSSDQQGLLGDLAYVIDGAPSPAGSVLRQAHECPNAMAFWAVLSAGALPAGVNLNESAVEVAIAAMLPEYREVYAGKVIARLREGGFEASAQRIEGLLSRTQDAEVIINQEYDPGDLSDKTLEERLSILRTLAFSNGASSARALRALLEEHVEERIALDDALLTFAGSFVETVEDDEDRVAIHAGLLFSLVLSGYPFEALQAYERLLIHEPELARTHLDTLVALATDIIPDNDYALFIISLQEKVYNSDISIGTSLGVARRLVAVGMPSKALDVLTRRDLDGSEEKRLISAHAFLAMGDPEAALGRVGNIPGDEARGIKARAYLRMGQYDRAFPYLDPGDPLRVSAGWIARASDAVDLQPAPRKSLLEHIEHDASNQAGAPSTTTALLEETSEIRATISELLQN